MADDGVEGVVLPPEPMPASELDLVRRAQAGEIVAFEQLYRRHVALIHAVCRRMSPSVARAEELTQDVFIRAWRNLASFRHESAFATWLTRLAVNVVLSERRRLSRREGHEEAAEDLEGLAGPTPAAHPGAAIDLEKAIAALPPGARTVLLLHDVQGLDHAEIAAALGVAVGTSKAQLHRARKLLREVLS